MSEIKGFDTLPRFSVNQVAEMIDDPEKIKNLVHEFIEHQLQQHDPERRHPEYWNKDKENFLKSLKIFTSLKEYFQFTDQFGRKKMSPKEKFAMALGFQHLASIGFFQRFPLKEEVSQTIPNGDWVPIIMVLPRFSKKEMAAAVLEEVWHAVDQFIGPINTDEITDDEVEEILDRGKQDDISHNVRKASAIFYFSSFIGDKIIPESIVPASIFLGLQILSVGFFSLSNFISFRNYERDYHEKRAKQTKKLLIE